jgi:hypothetical protein
VRLLEASVLIEPRAKHLPPLSTTPGAHFLEAPHLLGIRGPEPRGDGSSAVNVMIAGNYEDPTRVRKLLHQSGEQARSEILVLLLTARERQIAGNEHEIRRFHRPRPNLPDDGVVLGDAMEFLTLAVVHVREMKPTDRHAVHHLRLILLDVVTS